MYDFYGDFNEKEIYYQRVIKKIAKFLKNNFYLILCMFGVVGCVFNGALEWDGNYIDGDGYMRLVRIKQWLLKPSFWEQKINVSNYPFGEVLHWTRPVDFLWLIVSVLFIGTGSLDDILFLGGAFLSPILGVLAVLCLGYGLKRVFNVWLALVGCAMFLNHHLIQLEFAFCKADHHSVMILLFVYGLANVLCWCKKRQNRYITRLALGLGLASLVMIDGVVLAILFIGVFVSWYVFSNVSVRYAYRLVRDYSFSILILWLLNPPFEGVLYVDNGRLSVLFVVAFALLAIGLKILDVANLHTKKLKFVSLMCMGGIILVSVIAIFGKKAFMIPVSEDVYNIWANQIMETKSFMGMNWDRKVSVYVTIFLALAVNIYLLRFKDNRKILWANLFLGGSVFICALLSVRFCRYFALFEIVPWLCLIDRMYKNSDYFVNNEGEFPAKIYAVILLIMFISPICVVPGFLMFKSGDIEFFSPLVEQKVHQIGGTLVTDTFLAPRYVWDAKVNTVSTPYHRNVEGIVDGVNILFAKNDEELLKLLLKHQVTQILLFEDYNENFYNMDEKNKDRLYWRLIKRNRVPYFLEEVTTEYSYVRLFKVSTEQ